MPVPEQIFQQVIDRPDDVAVVSADRVLSYRLLWQRAQAWRDTFRPHLSAGEQAVIAITRPRDAELPAIQLGAWLAGAAYLPLDPTTPAARVARITSDAGCRIIVTASGHDDPPGLVALTAAADIEPAPPVRPVTDPRSLAYLIFTSGSSGRPKGVAMEHGSLDHLIGWYAPMCGIGPGTRTGIFAGLGFDATVGDTWAPLARGGELYVPDESIIRSPEAVLADLDRAAVQHSLLSTPVAEYVIGAEHPPRRLRSLIAGGDRLRVWPAATFPSAVYNGYGPTETCMLTTVSTDLRTHPGRTAGSAPSIGRAAGSATVLVVDQDGNEITEPGRPGELLIGGPGLARGYYRAPELTDAAFVRFPDGTRWYRSGDVCAWTASGELEFLGRRDGQVKIRGHRIELGEVEYAIMRAPGVRLATAAVVTDHGGDPALVAWITSTPGTPVTREFLREWLPEAMIPAEIIHVDQLPLNANGKPDRAALVAGYRPGATAGPAADNELETETERALARVWQELLGRAPLPDSNFFELGGHSLKAQQLIVRLRATLGVRMSVIDLFDHPDLRSFAAHIDDQRAGATS
jgi:amino acid adenylation domain-containing protein